MSNTNYESMYGASKSITAAAYIAEIIIKRQSSWSKIKLPHKFWSNDDFQQWTAKWMNQKRLADGLIRAGFEPKVIILVLAENDNIGTLNNKRMANLLTEKKRKLENAAQVEHTTLEANSTSEKPRQPIGRPSKLNKLRD